MKTVMTEDRLCGGRTLSKGEDISNLDAPTREMLVGRGSAVVLTKAKDKANEQGAE